MTSKVGLDTLTQFFLVHIMKQASTDMSLMMITYGHGCMMPFQLMDIEKVTNKIPNEKDTESVVEANQVVSAIGENKAVNNIKLAQVRQDCNYCHFDR